VAKFKNIRIKMANGKSRIQRAKVLASGKLKFVKNTGRKVKSTAKRAHRAVKRRVTKRRSPSKSPVRRNSTKKRSKIMVFGGIKKTLNQPTVRKVLMAAGLVSVAISVLSLISPKAALTVARPEVRAGLGFISGDFIGAASQFLLAGGAQSITGLLGGGNGGGNGGTNGSNGFA